MKTLEVFGKRRANKVTVTKVILEWKKLPPREPPGVGGGDAMTYLAYWLIRLCVFQQKKTGHISETVSTWAKVFEQTHRLEQQLNKSSNFVDNTTFFFYCWRFGNRCCHLRNDCPPGVAEVDSRPKQSQMCGRYRFLEPSIQLVAFSVDHFGDKSYTTRCMSLHTKHQQIRSNRQVCSHRPRSFSQPRHRLEPHQGDRQRKQQVGSMDQVSDTHQKRTNQVNERYELSYQLADIYDCLLAVAATTGGQSSQKSSSGGRNVNNKKNCIIDRRN